jgi:hypothetical protein
MTLMNKIKRVKQFKESIKRYTLQRASNNFDTNSEIDTDESGMDGENNHNSDAKGYNDLCLQGSTKLW